MPLSMSQASMPVLTNTLQNLTGILRKGEANAAERRIDPDVFIYARLAPDMHPLCRQVQIATDIAKGCVARLAGLDIPSYPDMEMSFDDLFGRIQKTMDFVNSVTPAQIDGTEEKVIVLKFPGREVVLSGSAFLLNFSLPNLFFHATTTFAILRHNGVPLGKIDFLGSFGAVMPASDMPTLSP